MVKNKGKIHGVSTTSDGAAVCLWYVSWEEGREVLIQTSNSLSDCSGTMQFLISFTTWIWKLVNRTSSADSCEAPRCPSFGNHERLRPEDVFLLGIYTDADVSRFDGIDGTEFHDFMGLEFQGSMENFRS